MLKDLFKKAQYITVPDALKRLDKSEAAAEIEEQYCCPKCKKNTPMDEFVAALSVCPHCGQMCRSSSASR